jgi:hypothetical protein
MTFKLLLSSTLENLPIFELDASCSYLVLEPFKDTTMVDTFLQLNISFLMDATQLGSLHIFLSKTILDYFSRELTRLYPLITHIDILDKRTSFLSEIKPNETINDNIITIDSKSVNKKIKFNIMDNKLYFSSLLRDLFNYIPLIYPTNKNNCTSIMLIDSTISGSRVFYDAANETTLPILFNNKTLRSEIINLLMLPICSLINRLCIVATNKNMYNNTKIFINNEPYFTTSDIEQYKLETSLKSYSKNMQFMIDLIQIYNIKTIDFIACESLTYITWKQYYVILQSCGCVIGASSDKTGNIVYGGDWVMESNNEDIQSIYFTNTIYNYQSLLDQATVIYLGFGPNGNNAIGEGHINAITSTTETSYSIPSDSKNITFAIYNTFKTQQVTVFVSNIDASNNVEGNTGGYDIQINSMLETIDYGNGSNVIIEGAQLYSDNTQLNFRGYSSLAFDGDRGFVTLIDGTSTLTGIVIQNIDVLIDSNSKIGSYEVELDNSGWVCAGAGGKENEVVFNDCNLISDSNIIINRYFNGGICGGGYNVTGDGGIYIFTNCSIVSNNSIVISEDGGGNGGICGGGNNNEGNGGIYIFNSCSVTSSNIIIGDAGIHNGGICGGQNNYDSGNGGTYTFNYCFVSSGNVLIIGNNNYNGGICGGGFNNLGNGGTYTFNYCSVSSGNTLTIGDDIGISISNGGICGGGNNSGGNGGIYTFNSCSTTGNDVLLIGNGGSNGGICGGGYNESGDSGLYTFNICSIIVKNSIIVNAINIDNSFNYISGSVPSLTDPETIIDDQQLIYGDSITGLYNTPSIVIRSNDMRTIFTQTYKNTFTNYNLSGIDLSGVDLSNYNLSNTLLSGSDLTNVIFSNTFITDGPTIANNIVKNSGITIFNGTYKLIADIINPLGMAALKLGINSITNATLNHILLSKFVFGLFSSLSTLEPGFTNNTKVIIPATVLPTFNPWNNLSGDVQLINSSIFTKDYIPNTIINLNMLDTSCVFFYILLLNYPDKVEIINASDTLYINTNGTIYNSGSYNFTCRINNGTPIIKNSGESIAFANKTFYIGSVSWSNLGNVNPDNYDCKYICLPPVLFKKNVQFGGNITNSSITNALR